MRLRDKSLAGQGACYVIMRPEFHCAFTSVKSWACGTFVVPALRRSLGDQNYVEARQDSVGLSFQISYCKTEDGDQRVAWKSAGQLS